MKIRLQSALESEDLAATSERNKRLKTSTNGREAIPIDLIVEILSRLPVKSIARFRFLWKQCRSILDLPYFIDLYFTRSMARPRLLFACKGDGQVSYSSPQPHHIDSDDEEWPPSLSLAANYQMKILYTYRFERFTCFVFLRYSRTTKGHEHHVSLICNPSTGQFFTLPKVRTRRRLGGRSYFGYDPIDQQYKLLSMTWLFHGTQRMASEEHQILTFGNERKPTWRRIRCCVPHSPHLEYHQICINSVLYYPAVNKSSGDFIIVCFHVRSEEFSFVKDTDTSTRSDYRAPLINYNGKLGSLESHWFGFHTSIKLRVLEDAEKQEWSEHIFVLPASWINMVGGINTSLHVVGVTRKNEIVLSLSLQAVPFYVFYYNTVTNIVIRIQIQGMEAFKNRLIYTFLDHVEDVTPMEVVSS